MNSKGMARTLAIIGRKNAVNRGSKLSRAHLVMGREREKKKTPMKANHKPEVSFFERCIATECHKRR
jgi:hypothetical protein